MDVIRHSRDENRRAAAHTDEETLGRLLESAAERRERLLASLGESASEPVKHPREPEIHDSHLPSGPVPMEVLLEAMRADEAAFATVCRELLEEGDLAEAAVRALERALVQSREAREQQERILHVPHRH